MKQSAAELLLEYRVPAQVNRLKDVRRALREVLRRHGVSAACARDVVMAVDEACQNIIRHAYGGEGKGEIVLCVRSTLSQLELVLRDFAPAVDPACIHPRPLDELRPGGLGTHLIREAMDEVEYLRPSDGTGNLLRLVKRLEPDHRGS